MEQLREKHEYFFWFEVSSEMYETIKGLPWVESSEPRETPKLGIESLKVVGKNFKVAYAHQDGTFTVREAYRFLCEGLVGLKNNCESGGFLTEIKYKDDE